MNTVHAILRERLLARAALAEPRPVLKLADLERSEWSGTFERLMRNRLIMGALRYGRLHAPGKRRYDRVGGAQKRLLQYQQSGNTECLVDAANMCLLECEEGRHPFRHFHALNGDHCCARKENA
jgi:hypothetical protein